MLEFLLAFLAAALASLAGREGARAARLGTALGPASGLTLAIVLAALFSSALAAWLGWQLVPTLSPAARQIFAAIALMLAALKIWLLKAAPAPREPTRSFGAILLVLAAAQCFDAARLLVLAAALRSGEPWLAAAGGALGSGAVLLLARAAGPAWETRLPLSLLRHSIAALFLLSGMIGLAMRGLIG